MILKQILMAITIMCLACCARVDVRPLDRAKIYDCSITGVRCYMPQPYLQVTVTTDKDGTHYATEVISLPDLEHPIIADVQPGWGTVNGTITLNEHGILTAIGSQLDSKIPETITAVSGLISAVKPSPPMAVSTKIGIYLLKIDVSGGKLVLGDPIPVTLP